MPFEIIRNEITNMRVDVIVNAANPRPVIGSGTGAAIHGKAGPMLMAGYRIARRKECLKIPAEEKRQARNDWKRGEDIMYGAIIGDITGHNRKKGSRRIC